MKAKRKNQLLSFALAFLMAAMIFMPSLSTTASAASPAITETYYKNGNRIVETLGTYTYNGMSIPYRVVTITPSNSSSKLIYSGAKVSTSAKTAFKAGLKNIVQIAVDAGVKKIPVVGTIYDSFKTLSSISASFSKETYVKNATGTMLIDAKKSIVAVYIDWGGWKLAYGSEKVYGNYTATVLSSVVNGVNLPHVTKSGTYSQGTNNYNLKHCCDIVIKNGGGGWNGYEYNEIKSVTMTSLDTSTTVKTLSPGLYELGMKRKS